MQHDLPELGTAQRRYRVEQGMHKRTQRSIDPLYGFAHMMMMKHPAGTPDHDAALQALNRHEAIKAEPLPDHLRDIDPDA